MTGATETSGRPTGAWLAVTVAERFIEQAYVDMVQVAATPDELLAKFEAYTPPTASKAAWVLKMTEELE